MRCALVAALAALLASAPRTAPAEAGAADPAALVADGQRRYLDQDYDGAVASLEAALASPELETPDRVVALEVLGCAHLVLGRTDRARRAFAELLGLDPLHELAEPSGSPRILGLFEEVRREVASRAAPVADLRLRLELPREARLGEPFELEVLVEGPHRLVGSVAARLRRPGERRFGSPLPLRGLGDRFTLTLRAAAPGRLGLYVEAFDSEGRALARAGGPHEPHEVLVTSEPGSPAGPSGPGARRRSLVWVWAVAGTAAAAIALGVVLGLVLRPAPLEGDLPPGRIVLE